MKHYSKLWCTLLVCIISGIMYAQDAGSGEERDVNLIPFPVSPEAASLGNYGNVPVNLSTGQMNFPIPIYNISSIGGYSWPVSLSYNFKGLIYQDKPSITGLGWNLNAGGVVTREVRGIPDEHPNGYYGIREERERLVNPFLYGNTLLTEEISRQLINGDLDGEADKYYVSVNGISFSFKVGLDKSPVYLSEHNYIVEFDWKTSKKIEFNGFIVTDDQGIKYRFYEQELNEPYGGNYNVYNDAFTHNVSSWQLSEVIYPNGETLNFSYNNDSYISYDYYATGSTNEAEITCGNGLPTQLTTYTDGVSKTKITRKLLSRIEGTNSKVSFSRNLIAQGSNDRVLYEGIYVVDKFSNTIVWNYSLDYEGTRDMLKQITRNGEHYYSFEYQNKNQIPGFLNNENANAFKQDLWGFYNGKNNQYGVNVAGTSYKADKRPSFTHASAGALKKIIYPTKGYSEIAYEQNTVKKPYAEVIENNANLAPNWEIDLKFKSDETTRQPQRKEVSYTYTFTEPTIAEIKHELTSVGISFSGISMTRVAGEGSCASSTQYDALATQLRAINSDEVPAMCPHLYEEIDDKYTVPNTETIRVSGSSGGKIEIKPGTYRLSIWTDQNRKKVEGRLRVRFYKAPRTNGEETPEFLSEEVGGIRIKSITDYSSESQRATTRYYDYVAEDGYSSGKELQIAIASNQYRLSYCCNVGSNTTNGGAGIIISEQTRNNYNSMPYNRLNLNQGVPVIYTKVRTYQDKKTIALTGRSDCNVPGECIMPLTDGGVLNYIGTGVWNFDDSTYKLVYPQGYTESTYGYTVRNFDVYPIVPQGVDQDMGRLLTQHIYEYDEKNKEEIIKQQEEREYKTVSIFNGSFDSNPNHPKSIKLAYKIKREGECAILNPDEYDFREYYKYDLYKEIDTRYLVSRITTKQYYPEEMQSVQQLQYDNKNQLKKTIAVDSEGSTIEQENYYSYDFSSGIASSMVRDANIITPIIATKTKKDGILITHSQTDYTEISLPGIYHDKLFKPAKQLQAKGGAPLEGRMKYSKYDAKGNLLEYYPIIAEGATPAEDIKGTPTAVIWGYNYQYPVAKIENATYAEAIALLEVSIAELQNLDGTVLLSELNKIRERLPQAFISTYSYKPQVGVLKMVDPKGYTMHYSYDNLHRVKEVKDQDGNIITEYQYNYKN
ncbi:hypothetical protein [Aquimarina rhabdastrellae]